MDEKRLAELNRLARSDGFSPSTAKEVMDEVARLGEAFRLQRRCAQAIAVAAGLLPRDFLSDERCYVGASEEGTAFYRSASDVRAEARRAERERCAKVAKTAHSAGSGSPGDCCSWAHAHDAIADAIRALPDEP